MLTLLLIILLVLLLFGGGGYYYRGRGGRYQVHPTGEDRGIRLFLAVWPPPDVVATLDALPRPDVAGVRWVPSRNLHVTLRFLGDVADVDGAQETSGDRLRDARAVTADLGPAVDRFGDRVLHVPAGGLDDLAHAVREPDDADDSPFRGHLTLARSRGARLAPLTGTPVSARWPVGEVTLVASRLGRGSSTYEVLARFPLRGSL